MSPRAALAATVCAALLGGCGPGATAPPGSGSPTPGPTPTPLPGTPFSNSRFATIVPAGWTNRVADVAEVQKFSGSGEVEYLVEQEPTGTRQQNVNDVVANINVVRLTTTVPDDQVPQYLDSVTASGAANLSAVKPFTLDGSTGQYIVYDRDISGTPGESEEMVVNHGGSSYDIVITTSQFAYPRQQSALEAVLLAWHWLT